MMQIPFERLYLTGKEQEYVGQAMQNGYVSGDGVFTKKCHEWFVKKYDFEHVFLTNSCTDALEMCGLLLGLGAEDEVIMPSYTFVSTANAFMLRGVKLRFADSLPDSPNLDLAHVERLITPSTRALVVIHYGGFPCQIAEAVALCQKYNLYLIEDAAQAIDAYYAHKSVGKFGHLATFSFHQTKNITCGEGGLLVVNHPSLVTKAHIIRQKGTNRNDFLAGKVSKYQWVDVGSSFLPSDVTAAFLFAQLEALDDIQQKRKLIWEKYYKELFPFARRGCFALPLPSAESRHNFALFYLVCRTGSERDTLSNHLKIRGISAAFHYLALHESPFWLASHKEERLPYASLYTDCLLRLPFFTQMTEEEIAWVVEAVKDFYENKS